MQVGLQAYLLWEQAGKPDGANFSDDARLTLEKQLQQGKTVEDLERILKGPPGQPAKQVEQASPHALSRRCCHGLQRSGTPVTAKELDLHAELASSSRLVTPQLHFLSDDGAHAGRCLHR